MTGYRTKSQSAANKAANYRRASTTITQVITAGLVTGNDADTLRAAAEVLARLAKGQDKTKIDAKRQEERDERLRQLAHKALVEAFGGSIQDVVALAVASRHWSSSPEVEIRRMIRDAAEPYVFPNGSKGSVTPVARQIADLRMDVIRGSLVWQAVKSAEKDPVRSQAGELRAVAAAVADVRQRFEAVKTEILERHKDVLADLMARAVADELERANHRAPAR